MFILEIIGAFWQRRPPGLLVFYCFIVLVSSLNLDLFISVLYIHTYIHHILIDYHITIVQPLFGPVYFSCCGIHTFTSSLNGPYTEDKCPVAHSDQAIDNNCMKELGNGSVDGCSHPCPGQGPVDTSRSSSSFPSTTLKASNDSQWFAENNEQGFNINSCSPHF